MKNSAIFILCVLNILSCANDKIEVPGIAMEDCRYQFPENLEDIYGAWEIRVVKDLATGDTTFYSTDEGPQGFMLGNRYADAFELRPTNTFTTYYTSSGRFCEERSNGSWFRSQDTLYFSYGSGANTYDLTIPILSLTATELIIQDTIDFVPSIGVMRKWEEE